MRRIRIAEQAFKLAIEPNQQQYICRTCLAQAARHIHTSVPRTAQLPFLKRLQNSIFGSKESKQTIKATEEARKRQLEGGAKRSPKKKIWKNQTYEVAALVDPSTHDGYHPAETWDGLEHVGGTEWAQAQADTGVQYTGFIPKNNPKLDNSQWQMLLHQVVVEILTLQKAGRDVHEVCGTRTQNSCAAAAQVDILNEQGTASLRFPSEKIELEILAAMTEPGGTLTQKELLTEMLAFATENEQKPKFEDTNGAPSWMEINLRDREVMFALVKRVMQLTGRRIPDHALSEASTLIDVYRALRTVEKPKKLYAILQSQNTDERPSNVTIFGTRRTPVHKEKEVGRWKLIEEELVKRDLPVLGSRHREVKDRLLPL